MICTISWLHIDCSAFCFVYFITKRKLPYFLVLVVTKSTSQKYLICLLLNELCSFSHALGGESLCAHGTYIHMYLSLVIHIKCLGLHVIVTWKLTRLCLSEKLCAHLSFIIRKLNVIWMFTTCDNRKLVHFAISCQISRFLLTYFHIIV